MSKINKLMATPKVRKNNFTFNVVLPELLVMANKINEIIDYINDTIVVIPHNIKGTDMDGGVKGVIGSNAVVDDEDEQVYKKEFIEKACDWLQRSTILANTTIERFRQAMEEQQ